MTPSGNKSRDNKPQTEQSEKRDFFILVLLEPAFICQDEASTSS